MSATAAPWILAGGLLLCSFPAAAQGDDGVAGGPSVTLAAETSIGSTAVPEMALAATGAGILAGGEGSWLSLGAVAGAAVAVAYAARERFNNRR